jgi:integrase
MGAATRPGRPGRAERVLAAQLGAVADTITLQVWLRRYVDRLGKSVDEETKRKYRRMIDRDIVPFFNGSTCPSTA